jgi:hypothetical protein
MSTKAHDDDKKKDPAQERLDELVVSTGLDRDELIDRLLVGAYSEGSFPSASELLSG